MDIMDMTLKQILIGSLHDLPKALIVISFLLNTEGIIRQYAVNKGYTKAVNWCDHIAKFLNFLTDILPSVFQKHFTKAVPIILLCIGLPFATGCASYNQKAVCLQLGTTNASIPYVGGATNGSGYACYLSCLGSKCPTPDDQDITKLMEAELTATNNSIITSGPVRVTATPLK